MKKISKTPVVIRVQDIVRSFGKGDAVTHALGPVNFEIHQGDFVVILGKSGSGKSTLLNILSGLDTPTSGEVWVKDKNLVTLKPNQLAQYRASIGIIFQSYNLLPNLTAGENVSIGSWAGGGNASQQDVSNALAKFDLSHRQNAKVTNLSGGEKQRVSIARSLISNPDIIFCDEPTGALDSQNEDNVIAILQKLHAEGKTIIVVTHNNDFAELADQVLYLKDGLQLDISATSHTTNQK